jgi:5-methylcytosine-specific restriction endonuclease McrA
VCPHCEKEKSADQFYRRSSRDGKNLSGYCKECTNQTTVERQKATKLKAVAFMGGACQKCGYSAYAGALEFHHTNPAKKDFQIGAKGTRSFESIKKELLKCVLLCSNCHKEEHNKKGS